MPGVVITTAVRTGPTSDTVRESSQAFFVGLADKGTTDEAVLVQSLAEFEEYFGKYVTYAYLHPTVQTLNRKSTRLNSSHIPLSRMPSSA